MTPQVRDKPAQDQNLTACQGAKTPGNIKSAPLSTNLDLQKIACPMTQPEDSMWTALATQVSDTGG